MITAPIPANEEARLRSLDEYQLIDMLPDDSYDAITKIAATVCRTPVALINIIGKDLQYTKSNYGMELDQSSRANSFCGHAINHPDEVMIVPDARLDERFHDNPATTGDLQTIFYAGVPLTDDDGNALGTLCVVDHQPRQFSNGEKEALKGLATLVKNQFDTRKVKLQLKHILENRDAARILTLKLDGSVQRLASSLTEIEKPELDKLKQTIDSMQATLR